MYNNRINTIEQSIVSVFEQILNHIIVISSFVIICMCITICVLIMTITRTELGCNVDTLPQDALLECVDSWNKICTIISSHRMIYMCLFDSFGCYVIDAMYKSSKVALSTYQTYHDKITKKLKSLLQENFW